MHIQGSTIRRYLYLVIVQGHVVSPTDFDGFLHNSFDVY